MSANVRPTGDAVIALCLAAVLIILAAVTTSGVDESITVSGAGTWAEIVITLLGAGAVAAALVLSAPARLWGATTIALFAALTALTALSIIWSVQPDNSWQAANLALSYLAAFAGAAALARLLPGRWRALIWAIVITSVGLSAYALARKVYPVADQTLGRLQTPLGYWNAIGVMAAIGFPPCLWIWSRRDSAPAIRGLAVPAVAILISVVALSYSRSAAIAAVVAIGCSIVFVPRRLSAAALLGAGRDRRGGHHRLGPFQTGLDGRQPGARRAHVGRPHVRVRAAGQRRHPDGGRDRRGAGRGSDRAVRAPSGAGSAPRSWSRSRWCRSRPSSPSRSPRAG